MKKILSLLTSVAVIAAAADTLTLKSGSVLVGKAGLINAGKLKFTTDELGEIAVATDNIVKLVSDAEHREVPIESIPIEEKPPETWHGSVNVAYSGDRGNAYKDSGSVTFTLSRRWDRDRFTSNGGYYRAESGATKAAKTKTTDRWAVEGRHDHFWGEKTFTFFGARYEENKITELDYRYRFFTGLGYQYLDDYEETHTGIWNFNQQFGFSYIRERFENPDPDDNETEVAYTYRHEFKLNPIWNKSAELFHNFEYLPQIDDTGNFLVKANIGYSTKIIMNLNIVFKVLWDFDSRPAEGTKKLDTHYIVGLGYKW